MTKRRAGAIVRIGDRDIDLVDSLPVTLGDMIDLEDRGISLSSFENTAKNILIVLGHFSRKIDPEITDEALRALSDTEIGRAFAAITTAEQRPDPKS